MIANQALYDRVKKEIYRKYPKHSAYRSGLLVQEYKSRGGTYVGKKPTNTGLNRWFKERWRTQDDKVGYSKKSDVYRPTRRVNKSTPKTFKELGKKKVRKAQKLKKKTGRAKFN